MKFVVDPVSYVGRPAVSIVECSFPLESVVFEVAFVVDSIWIDESSVSIFHSILYHSFEVAFIFIGLYDEHAFIFIFGSEFILAEGIFVEIVSGLLLAVLVELSGSEGEFLGGFVGFADFLDAAADELDYFRVGVEVFFV